MSLSFEQTWPLLLLVGVVPILWMRRQSLIEFHPRQVTAMIALRALAFVLVVLALAQPVLHRSGSWLSVVWLLDVSRSVDPREVDEGIDWISRTAGTGAIESDRFVAFGANALSVPDAESLRAVPVADGPVRGAVDRSATDLAAALERAIAALPPYHVPRVVLVSDGNTTRGEVDAALEHLMIEGVEVHTRPAQGRREGDAWVDDVHAEDTVSAGLPFDLLVAVRSQAAREGVLVVEQDGRDLLREPITLEPGARTLALRPVVDTAGPAVLRVRLEIPGDPVEANNEVEVPLHVRQSARVLYVEGRADTAEYLRAALESGGFDVTVVSPLALPDRPEGFDDYDAVILSDVLPERLSEPVQHALTQYVEQLGGGLLFAGGESVYGEDGYSESQIEQVTPVWFKAEREPKDLALVVALDKSYSMVGDKMELAKEASKAAVDLLEDEQQFGLLAFDYHFYWPVTIQEARDKVRIRERISAIEASSPTNIYPALQDVFQSLLATEAEIKHVILLSDGKTYEDDYEGLVTRMAEAEITVSTVAVGDKADRELLGAIAEWGNGRSYYIEDPTRVPQIFVDETQMAQGITIEEGGDVVPLLLKPIEALAGIEIEEAPPLAGFTRTMAKDSAEVVLETEEGDPILVRWQYGLGRAAFWAPDVKNRWSARWVEWDGYAKFWTQLLRETMRQTDFLEPDLRLRRAEGRVEVELDLVDERGRFRNALRPAVAVTVGAEESREIELAQVAPGRYRAALAAPADTTVAVRWESDDATIERRLVPEPARELRFRPADDGVLRRLADRTGGVHAPDDRTVAAASSRTVVRPLRLAPGLAALALVAYLANMLLRRVRVWREAGLDADF